MHQHDEHCACGEHHHEETCACGNHHHDHTGHHHEHGEHCGCGHTHVPIPTPDGLTSLQVDFLMELRQRQCLPVACFSFAKSDDASRYGVALAPVFLSNPGDTMAQVKQLGNELAQLEDMGLITLDYDIPLQQYAYAEYHTSDLYAYFVRTVQEAAQKPDATFDTPTLELGSMALTDAGHDMVDALWQLDAKS